MQKRVTKFSYTENVDLILKKAESQSIRPDLPKTMILKALEKKLLLINTCFPEVLRLSKGIHNALTDDLRVISAHVREPPWLTAGEGTDQCRKEKVD